MNDKQVQSTLQKDSDGTITLTITIPLEKIKKGESEEIEKAVKNAAIPGFRQGKAPRNLVEERLDKEKIREEVLKKLLPDAYLAAIKEHNLKPIISPKIHVAATEEGKEWSFTAITCETPEIILNKYKDAVQKFTAKSKIIIPGKEQQKPNFDEIVKIVLENISVTIPSILIEGEVDRLLSQLLTEIKALGLSLEQYVASTGKTPERLRDEYKKKAENDIKFEFSLQKIAEEEKITIEQKEIDEALQKAKDEKERKQLESNVYLLASILRQQKTLDFLKNL